MNVRLAYSLGNKGRSERHLEIRGFVKNIDSKNIKRKDHCHFGGLSLLASFAHTSTKKGDFFPLIDDDALLEHRNDVCQILSLFSQATTITTSVRRLNFNSPIPESLFLLIGLQSPLS